MAYKTEGFDFEAHIDKIGDYADSLEYGKITILTGPNGYGKSLLRKIIQMETPEGKKLKTASVSMSQRTNANHDFGALSGMMMDTKDDATSNHTSYIIESLLKSNDEKYIVIDEPEIGMGKEVLLGLINNIQSDIAKRKDENRFHGMLIITHSEFLIDNFQYDNFVNLEGMTYDEWKNRKIEAIDPKELKMWCLELWRAIEKRIRTVKESKNK